MRWEPMVVRAARWAFFGVFVAGIGFATAAPMPAPETDSVPLATDVRLGGDEAQTRFIMDISQKIDLHVFTLADRFRPH